MFKNTAFIYFVCVCAHTHVECAYLYTHVHSQRAEKGIMCPPLPTYSFEEESLAKPKAHVLSRLAASMKDPPIRSHSGLGLQACMGYPASYSGPHDWVTRACDH